MLLPCTTLVYLVQDQSLLFPIGHAPLCHCALELIQHAAQLVPTSVQLPEVEQHYW